MAWYSSLGKVKLSRTNLGFFNLRSGEVCCAGLDFGLVVGLGAGLAALLVALSGAVWGTVF
jgi:hypothetical protein